MWTRIVDLSALRPSQSRRPMGLPSDWGLEEVALSGGSAAEDLRDEHGVDLRAPGRARRDVVWREHAGARQQLVGRADVDDADSVSDALDGGHVGRVVGEA